MQRIGIYGGTFNPPHVGHIRGAQYALEALALDAVLLIPDHTPPHKQLPEGSASPEQRLAMLRLAAVGAQGIQVSDLALQREGISYTYETVEQVRESYPNAKLYLLMGSDMFASFDTWKQVQRITAQAEIAVLCRGEKGEKQRIETALENTPGQVLENPVTAISSTDLRRLLAFDCVGEFLVPEVEAFIRGNGLYGTDRDLQGLSMEALEAAVVELLNPNRVRHVLGCREAAVALAKRWGADETDAARAALLHDITKALDGPLQLTLCRGYGKILDDFSTKNPKTLHALTGSLVAERIFGENPAVVAAIRSHTTGKADMDLLEKIIYVADYMEPNRDFPGVEELRELAYSDIDRALRLGLEMTLRMLKQQGRDISPESKEALRFLTESEKKG
ncbi:MAG: nicotinate (nicotinamide) nucleotide adenylyltransferase [Oscillospiraceae bacterium]|nr:nicotinate (nicotinamide) nucleotide adenylyltransferase [Oscillospiraceae bacterium]